MIDFLKFLTDSINFNKIQKIYGTSTIIEFQENKEELIENIKYLNKLGFDNIEDIIELFPYMFLIERENFKEKVNELIGKLGIDYLEKLNEDTSLWENVNEE